MLPALMSPVIVVDDWVLRLPPAVSVPVSLPPMLALAEILVKLFRLIWPPLVEAPVIVAPVFATV